MSEIILNAKYAPGIPTYGVRGEKGEKGEHGRSIFYVPNISDGSVRDCINKNKIYNTNISYNYLSGDSFIDSSGVVYQYTKDNNNDVSFNNIGELNFGSVNLFESSNEYIYNTRPINSFIIIKDGSTQESSVPEEPSDYLFQIISSNDNNKLIKIQKGDKKLTIEYDDTLEGFKFSSEDAIYFDNLYSLQNNPSKENTSPTAYSSEGGTQTTYSPVEGTSSNVPGKNNYQPFVNYFDISIDVSWNANTSYDDTLSNYNEDYIFECVYKDVSKNEKRIIIDDENIFNNFKSDASTILKDEKNDSSSLNFYLNITSKKYFVSKYKTITFSQNSSSNSQ